MSKLEIKNFRINLMKNDIFSFSSNLQKLNNANNLFRAFFFLVDNSLNQ